MAEEDFGIDDELEGQESRTGQRPAASVRRSIMAAVSLIIVVAVGYGTYSFFSKPSSKSPQTAEAISLETAQAAAEKAREEEAERLKKMKYVQLFTGLEGSEMSKIVRELSFAGIVFKSEQTGSKFSVSVDSEREMDARNLLAVKGLPSGGSKGYDLLDNSQTLGVTEFDKRIRFLRALSGELEKAILKLEMIQESKVQIVIPEPRLFTVSQPPVTAAILVRRIPGKKITDDVVFSIIQLVANAVENLQPENVKVIDTTGVVLSEGVLDRMKEQGVGVAATVTESETDKPVLPQTIEDAYGQPIIPNFDKIQEWFDLKWAFEQKLIRRVSKQLMGVLPVGSFKVAITSDLGPVENGEIVDIRRMTISIVVDSRNEDVFLDGDVKTQIFKTVSAASGYVKGRDVIQLSRADFSLLAPEDLEDMKSLEREYRFQTLFFKYGYKALPFIAGLVVLYFLYRLFRRLTQKAPAPLVEEDDSRSFQFDELKNDMNESKQVDKLRQVARREAHVLAGVMEKWLSEDQEVSASPSPQRPVPSQQPESEEVVDFGEDDLDQDAFDENDENFDDLGFDDEFRAEDDREAVS